MSGHKEITCDPSTKNDARRTRASELHAEYHARLPPHHRGLRTLLQTSPDQLGPEQIREYIAYLFRERKLTDNTVNQRVGALRFFFIKTLKKSWNVEETPYPKKRLHLLNFSDLWGLPLGCSRPFLVK